MNGNFSINVIHHLAGLDVILTRLDELKALLTAQQGATMASLTDLQAQVSANTNAEQSAVVLLGQLHDLLVAAKASGDPAQLDTLIAQLNTSKDQLAAAIVANTPSAPA